MVTVFLCFLLLAVNFSCYSACWVLSYRSGAYVGIEVGRVRSPEVGSGAVFDYLKASKRSNRSGYYAGNENLSSPNSSFSVSSSFYNGEWLVWLRVAGLGNQNTF